MGTVKAANPFDLKPSANPNATLYWAKLPEGGVFIAIRDNPNGKVAAPMLLISGNGVVVQKLRINMTTEYYVGDLMNPLDRMCFERYVVLDKINK